VAVSLARPRVAAIVGAVGTVVAVAGGLLLATSDHLVHPVLYGFDVALLIASTVWVALYWAVRRPGNRIAVVLLVDAGFLAVLALQGASNPVLHSLGVFGDVPTFFIAFYLLFIFPDGRVHGLLEKLVLAGVVGVILVSTLPWFFFSPVVAGGYPFAGCNANCPKNGLLISDNPTIAAGFGTTEEYLATALAVAIVGTLCYRLARASRPRRRASLPVYVPALLFTIPFGISRAPNAGLFVVSPHSYNTLAWFELAGRLLFSLGFLLAIVQASLLAGVALKSIMARLGEEDGPAHLRQLVADALDDPPLELAFELGHGSSLFVDSRGALVDRLRPRPSRSLTAIRRHGEVVAYIEHDEALESDPELMQAAGQSVELALESGRLEAELQSKIDELEVSRRRLVSLSEAERRKMERDLHDGAQQRLVAIQIKLALAKERAGDHELAEQLAAIEDDAAAASEELRNLAHGMYPSVLVSDGIGDALRSVARAAPITVRVHDEGLGRFPEEVEAAVYFCSREAIQNSIKHAGPGTHVTVTLEQGPVAMRFEIRDDGVGMSSPVPADGLGMASMRDRIGALGGEVEIVTAPGEGTIVRGGVPLPI
jgi:signal transduction histidine kinase